MPRNSFTVTVDLKAFFANHKSRVKIFINEDIKNVSNLEEKISNIFGIRNYHLICNGCLLPSCEDIRVLGTGDIIWAIPNEDREEIKLLDKTYYTGEEKAKVKEKRSYTKDVVEESPIVVRKPKKKKREIATPPKEDIPLRNETPKKIQQNIPAIRKEKIRTKDRAVSWSTNPLPKTINHVKIARIPLKTLDTESPEQMDFTTPDSMEKTEDYHPFASVSGSGVQTFETTIEYPITKKENPAYPNLPLQNNNTESTPSKKETELKNWKHSILEKFTHHLQTSEQKIQETQVEKNEITSTNREEFVNDSSSNSVVSKVTKLNPASSQVKKKYTARQTSGIGYYLKLMDKIDWDASKSISGIDANECIGGAKKKPDEEVEDEFSVNGDSTSDYPSDFQTKRKRKRKHKKRPRVATPIPRITTPLQMKYLEGIASNGVVSTPKNHIRFGETLQELESGQDTTIEDSSVFEEAKSEEKVVILQNLPLNSEPKGGSNDLMDEPDQYFKTSDTQPFKTVCGGERSSVM